MANNYWDRLKQFVTGVKTTTTNTSTTLTITNKEQTKNISTLAQDECSKVWDKTLDEASAAFESFEEGFAPIATLTGELDSTLLSF
jgi:hypothetical protein